MNNKIYLKLDCLDAYCLALYNNDIPLIDEIKIINETDNDFKNMELEISSSPSFFNSFVKKIDSLSSTRYIIVNPHDLEIDLTKVMYSVAPANSVVSIKLKSMGEVISEFSKNVLLLPYDYLPSVNDYTELLSAFVTPQQEEVKSVVPMVLECLKSDSDTPINQDMWDYSDKSTTQALSKSIYKAICNLKITFNTSIVNDNKPTKLKLPESVLRYKNGTGLEIALLTSSVAEYLGINTFIAFVQDKVLLGFFFGKEVFNTCISDDSRALEQLVNGICDDFAIVDTTSMINGTSVSFENSSITAQKTLDTCDFPIIVNIKRCREEGFLPLPSRIHQNGNLIFESITNSTHLKKNESSTFKSIESFCKTIKKSFTSSTSANSLFSLDKNATVFLIGFEKLIVSKILFNGKVFLKSFPFDNKFDDEYYNKLIQLNSNIDNTDLSGVINTFHERKTLNAKLAKILEKSSDELTTVCISLGTLVYKHNYESLSAPLVLIPVNLNADSEGNISLKVKNNNFFINPCINELLSNLYIQFDFNNYNSDIINNFDNMISDLSKAVSDNNDVAIYDVSCLSFFKTENHILSSLISPEYFMQSPFFSKIFIGNDDCTFNNEFSMVDFPFSLDSAQSKAVFEADNSYCTVIDGPNNSGKTLSCASLAFSALKRGERVLYISKSAHDINAFIDFSKQFGFEKFTMKLSDKEKNINSFDYLNVSLPPDTSVNLNEEKAVLMSEINNRNAYYKNLHDVKEIGFSLYEVISQYERYRSFPYSVSFSNEEISGLNRDDVVVWFDAISSMAKAGSDCKEPHANPLFFIKTKDFSYDLKSKAAILLNNHISIVQRFISSQNLLGEYLGIEMPLMREEQTDTLLKIAECALSESENIYYGAFLSKDILNSFTRVENLIIHCDDIFDLKQFINQNFTDDVIYLDCDKLLSEWRNANSKFAFAKTSALSNTKNKLKAYCLNPRFVTNDNFVDIITKLSRYKNGVNLIEESAKNVFELTGIDIKTRLDSMQTDTFEEIKNKISVVSKLMSYIDEIYEYEKKPSEIYNHFYNLFKNTDKLKNELSILLNDFRQISECYIESEANIVDILKLDITTAKEQNNKIWYYFVSQFFERMMENIDSLKYWCNWNIEKDKCVSLGLSNVIKLYESEPISSGDIKNAFLKGFFKSASEYFLSCDSNINNYYTESHNLADDDLFIKIKQYRKKLKESVNFTLSNKIIDYINNILKISVDEAEMILKNKFAFDIASGCNSNDMELLQTVKPCFIGDSTRILTKFSTLPKFDVIIVDSDYNYTPANLFMIMPLAKRFVYTQNKNTEFGKLLCSAGATFTTLNWLYNSNFSYSLANDLFYNSKLSLVPLMNKPRQGVSIIRQLGNYDRKKTRVNVIEASAVVDEIIKYLGDSSYNSIGVYTMTEEQKKLIELLIQKRTGLYTNSLLDAKKLFIKPFLKAEYEPCDVIIFSTVFSEEEHAKYKQSITKTIPELSNSKSIDCMINILTSVNREMSLVTSLSEESLDNFKTTEKNYCIFKKILIKLFNESNSRIQEINANNATENSIIRQVANFIESLGYKADLFVGSNNSKVDIAVKNKGNNNYLLGIIFDETAYINSDDYFGRNLNLKNLETVGKWNILRVLTVEWFENQNKQLDRIADYLNDDNFKEQISIAT